MRGAMPSSERGLDAGPARYRVRVSRQGPAGALTHLAQIEALRSAVVRSELPFVPDGKRKRPRPRISFGPAISVGYESLAEYFDLEARIHSLQITEERLRDLITNKSFFNR